ncbi:GCN5-related N-acetyltransferase [Haloterrigena turkmenica DSM 5511]|uniref:GCN5-related N-acetyltransferase n=1 Tax=Haloterrigena turkmenica (strain ATCC 51198 / DSM 5511 / JCM 9101 / NCIMB 13204 / VKM B-1734 / 4k) TaxID=543526 RepID=D2RYZ0_HALTV|nr:GNAT family N-acetyltransferase [Haloterrigena turkmenica]ADB61958.1 GCN5-related N-acetyltransferase [Haloterrigena turkmenica DSM 5511]
MTRAVRPATRDDAWAIHETARESWHAAYDEILGSDRVDEVVDDWYAIGDLESSIAGASERTDVAFLVAEPTDSESRVRSTGERSGEFDRECAGFAHAVPWPEDSAVGYLARLYVSPEIWGEGIGTQLLTRLERDLEHAFDRLRLAVLAANDVGIAFYESAGFERVATRENDLAAGLEEYVYERPIATEMR